MGFFVTEENINEKAKGWMAEVEPYNRSHLSLDMNKAALMVIDMQRYFLEPDMGGFTVGGAAILKNVKKLIDLFRANDRPVIFTRHVHSPDKSDAGIMEWWKKLQILLIQFI